MRRLTILSLVICAILFASGERARSAPRQAVPRCFDVPGIADCITGPVFDAFWAGNGGLPVFGYPLTGERPEQNRDLDQRFMTQWFERNRFEDHPENEPPYQVLLGRLGAELLQRQGRGVEGVPPGATPPGRCRAFDVGQERQFVCDPFLRYWETNGLEFDGRAGFSPAESLALFGLPLTSPRRETNPNGDSVTTQWFERARFEDHGTKGVLLGLLGHEMLATLPPVPPTTPIVDADTGFLLGGASGGQWIDVETAARAYRAGETYRLWTLDGPAGQATGGAISLEGQPCPSTVEIALTPEPADDYKIGFTGTWDPRPRAITRLSTATVVYREAVAEILRAQGISEPDVRLTQVLRFDLEGDGTDEVAITAKRMVDGDPSPRIGAGDYALVALRRLAGGVVHTLLLEGEFYPEAHEFAAPNEFTLTNVLDLNGDGRMEIVVDSRYYEGFAVAVFDITAAGARGVLGAGCGA